MSKDNPTPRPAETLGPEALANVLTTTGAQFPSADARDAYLRQVGEDAVTDLRRGNAFLALTASGQTFVQDRDRFAHYYPERGVWEIDASRGHLVAHSRAKVAVEDVYLQGVRASIAAAQEALDGNLPRSEGDRLARYLKRLHEAQKHLETNACRRTLVAEAKGRFQPFERFDEHDLLLNTPAGVVDLETGKVEPHRPGLYLTRQTDVDYVPGAHLADNPGAQAFRELVSGCFLYKDPEARALHDYAQEVFGAGVVGVPELRLIAVLDGPTGTLKSTLCQLLQKALGSYAGGMAAAGIEQPRYAGGSNSLTPELAVCVGRRFVLVDELPRGFRMDAKQVKKMTGNEWMEHNPKHEPVFKARNTHTVFVTTNHGLNIPAEDSDLWSRVYNIPFHEAWRIPEDQQDKRRSAELRGDKAVLRAALAWAVEGAQRALRKGFAITIPEAAVKYREGMRRASNLLADSLEAGVFVLDADAWTSTADLHAALMAHRRRTGVKGPVSFHKLGAELHDLEPAPVSKKRRVDGRDAKGWQGIALGPASVALLEDHEAAERAREAAARYRSGGEGSAL